VLSLGPMPPPSIDVEDVHVGTEADHAEGPPEGGNGASLSVSIREDRAHDVQKEVRSPERREEERGYEGQVDPGDPRLKSPAGDSGIRCLSVRRHLAQSKASVRSVGRASRKEEDVQRASLCHPSYARIPALRGAAFSLQTGVFIPLSGYRSALNGPENLP
jgi:hypothetical protein